MAKAIPDATYDAALDHVAGSDKMVVCSAQPTSFAEANATYALADVAMAGGDFTNADGDTSGRKVTMAAKNSVTVDSSGTANHLALVNTSDSTLRLVTTVTSQSLTSGNTVNIPSWKLEIPDPA